MPPVAVNNLALVRAMTGLGNYWPETPGLPFPGPLGSGIPLLWEIMGLGKRLGMLLDAEFNPRDE